MNVSLAFMRVFFLILSIFFMTTFMVSSPTGALHINAVVGVVLGIVFGFVLIGFDLAFKRFNLRSFNIVVIGIFIGYLMGQALVLIFDAVLDISRVSIILQPQTLEIIKIALFLFGTYLGTIMTLRASDELYVSIPFVKFAPYCRKEKGSDPRQLCPLRCAHHRCHGDRNPRSPTRDSPLHHQRALCFCRDGR